MGNGEEEQHEGETCGSICPKQQFVVDLGDHDHDENCGHERIQHEDHFDYLTDGGELHHLLEKPECCDIHSTQDHVWISHGTFQAPLDNVPVNHGDSKDPKEQLIQGHGCLCQSSHDCCSQIENENHRESVCPEERSILDLGDHEHHESCGHNIIKHGDHFDFVGDDGELHHLLETPKCCTNHMSKDKIWVSHGKLDSTASGHTLGVSDASSIKIYAEGICCPMEVPVIEGCLNHMPGVISVEVSVVTKTVTVKYLPAFASPAAMVAALNESRLEASLTFPRKAVQGKASWIPPVHVIIAAGMMLISLLHYLADPTGVEWMEEFKWVALGSVAIVLPGIILKAIGALRHFIFDIHLLIAIAAAGAIAIGDYTEAAIVVVLFAVADFLESRCTGQARDAISAVLELKPEKATLAGTGRTVDAKEVLVGTHILVKAGDMVPLDGIVISGSSTFDESFLTGESAPVTKSVGDLVRAGTLNSGSGLITVETTVSSEGTFVANMARLVEEATSRQSPSEQMVARFAKVYTPMVLLACILLAFVPWSNPDADRKAWVYLSLQLLVTACPCALVLSTPVTVVSALARAAQAGVLIRGGAILEALASIKVISFDKTGTLTKGEFLLKEVSILPENDLSEANLLRLLGSLERGSSHPLAAAIAGRAAALGAHCDANVTEFQLVPGNGIHGYVDGTHVAAGTAQFIYQQCGNVENSILMFDKEKLEKKGLTTCFVSFNHKYVAYLTASDTIRPETADAVQELHSLNLTLAILTGDNSAVASAIAKQARIDDNHVHAELLPQDKLDVVSAYREGRLPLEDESRGIAAWQRFFPLVFKVLGILSRKNYKVRVAHVGDGVNDAPALASADVGIAMGVGGAAAALEAGDVALFTNDLRILPNMYRLSRSAGRIIAFNIFISLLTKIIVLVLAFLQMFTLWGAVLVDVGTALLVTLNGLRLLRWNFGLSISIDRHHHISHIEPCDMEMSCCNSRKCGQAKSSNSLQNACSKLSVCCDSSSSHQMHSHKH